LPQSFTLCPEDGGNRLFRNYAEFLPHCITWKMEASAFSEMLVTFYQATRRPATTKTNRLMLFREEVAVYCENHMEHTNTLCGENVEF
jgi:hypothetical protein